MQTDFQGGRDACRFVNSALYVLARRGAADITERMLRIALRNRLEVRVTAQCKTTEQQATERQQHAVKNRLVMAIPRRKSLAVIA